jgi:hypothetical protein
VNKWVCNLGGGCVGVEGYNLCDIIYGCGKREVRGLRELEVPIYGVDWEVRAGLMGWLERVSLCNTILCTDY